MQIENKYLTINLYSRPGNKIGTIKGIVVHWVGNAGSSAIANRNYFEGLKLGKKNAKGAYIYASSHYIVGLEGEIIACVPEEEIAYHASKANKDHVGIEVCHPDWNGKFSNETYEALIQLILDICKRYNLNPLKDIVRHYDITGKDCPSYYVKHPSEWDKLKQDTATKLEGSKMGRLKIELNGVQKEVEAVNVNDFNFIKLRDLADEKIEVSYDAQEKLPIIKVK